jgi:hypothetical protein
MMQPRHRDLILNDPLATPEEVRSLGNLVALQHLNCPAAFWWQMAALYPLEAQKSPLYPLLMLEEPDRWVELEKQHVDSWIDAWLKFNAARERHFLAKCAARVPHFAEQRVNFEAWIMAQRFAAAVAREETGLPNYHVALGSQRGEEWDAVWDRERRWQWGIIQQIDRGEVT